MELTAQATGSGKYHRHSGLFCWYIFVPRIWLLLSCLVLPALLLFFQVLVLKLERLTAAGDLLIAMTGYSIYSDFWTFGGSCSKKSTLPGYLKTSVQGKEFLRKVLIWDCLVRFAVMALTAVLAAAAERYFLPARPSGRGAFAGEMILPAAQKVLTAYAISTLCILLERYCSQMIWYACFSSQGMFLLAIVDIFLSDNRNIPRSLLLVPAAACSLLFSVLAVQNVRKKMQEGNYDSFSGRQ